MITVYTDGGCSPNPGKGAWAFATDKKNFASGFSKKTTNNRMEMQAIYEAILHSKEKHPRQPITIISDSKYCVDGFNSWMHNWKKRNWFKKGGIKNVEIWMLLYNVKDDVTLKWVKGHSGNDMNDFVDGLCKELIEKN